MRHSDIATLTISVVAYVRKHNVSLRHDSIRR